MKINDVEITSKDEFDRALKTLTFNNSCSGEGVLDRLRVGGDAPKFNKDQAWELLRAAYSLIPDNPRVRYDSGVSSVLDTSQGASVADVLRESFESLKKELFAVVEQKVEDKVSELQGRKGDVLEDKGPVAPVRRYVDIRLDNCDDEGTTPVCPKTQWTEVVKPQVEKALKGVPVLNAVVNKGSVRLSFQNEDQLKEANDVLPPALGQQVQMVTETKALLDPRISIGDLGLDLLDKETLISEITSGKNEEIKKLVDEGCKVKVVHLNPTGRIAVLQVSPEIRNVIARKGDKVFLKLRQYWVRDRYHVVQCFHCQEFGHVAGSIRCTKKDGDAVCAFCAGNHETRSCGHKKRNDTGKLNCVNCQKSNSREDKRHSRSHLASSTLCPFFINERTKLMERTSGVKKEAKNGYRTRAMDELRRRRTGGLGH
jgi:hypothetical protein